MPGTLRFRLPALFLLGIVLGGLVAAAIATQLFRGLTRDESLEELRREVSGITQLYADAALRAADEGAAAPDFAPEALEEATGDRIYYVTREGRVFVVRAAPKFELLATNDLNDGSVFNASPAAADGRLYIRSDAWLYCFGER